jgi:hypothetical protein
VEIARAAVSRRPPISFYTIVARTHMYTYDAKVWALSLVQGPFSVAPCQASHRSDSQLAHHSAVPQCSQSLLIAVGGGAQGVYNATAPAPVRMGEMCSALGSAVSRPSWLPVPEFALQVSDRVERPWASWWYSRVGP